MTPVDNRIQCSHRAVHPSGFSTLARSRPHFFRPLVSPPLAAGFRALARAFALTALGLSLAAQAQAPDEKPPDKVRHTVVTGSRTESKLDQAVVATEVISRREIEASGAKDLGELLQTHPGIEVVYSFRGAGIRLQGLDPEYVLVLVDGARVSGRVGGVIDLSRFSLRDLERVEIVKGPASALYGSDAIGGVIHLITRRLGRPFEAQGKATYGSRGDIDFRGGAGVSRPRVDVRLGGGYRGAEPYDLDPRDVATNGAGFTRFDVDGAVEGRPTEALRLNARTSYLRKDERSIDAAPSGALFDRRERIEQFDAQLSGRARLSSAIDLELRAGHSLFRDQLLQDQRGSAALDEYTQSIDRLYELGAQSGVKAGAHQVTGGVEGLFERILSSRLAEGKGARQRLGLLLQDEWAVLSGPDLKVSPGVRLDLDSQFGSRPSPRLAVRFAPRDNVTLRGAYGWGFRSPSFQELFLKFENPTVGYVVDGNPALKPERSQGVNVSADWQVVERLGLSASLFRTDIDDLINIVTLSQQDGDSPTRFTYGNLSSARTMGGEVGARLRVSRGVYLDAGYTLVDTLDRQNARRLEGRPLHRGTFQLLGRYRELNLEWMVRGGVTGARPFFVDTDGDGAEDTVWTKPFVDLSAELSWRLNPYATLYAGGSNLANAFDTNYLSRPPRSFHVALAVQY